MFNTEQGHSTNECVLTEVVDDSNPQQGGISYRSSGDRSSGSSKQMRRRDTSMIKNTSKIFVGGLPGTVNDHEFREFFKQFGTVIDSAVIFDSNTRRSRGFGFVTFKEEFVAQGLLGVEGEQQIGSVLIRGKVCEVKPAEPKVDSDDKSPKMNAQNYHHPKFEELSASSWTSPAPSMYCATQHPFETNSYPSDYVAVEHFFPYQYPQQHLAYLPHETYPPIPPFFMQPVCYQFPYSQYSVMYSDAEFPHPQHFYPMHLHPQEQYLMHVMSHDQSAHHSNALTDDSDSTNFDISQDGDKSHDVHNNEHQN